MTISTPTVFLPGTLCDERIWFPVWKHLNCNQRSYVPLQWADTLEQMMMLTADRVNGFSQPVNLVGFSMGAYVAAKYVTEHANNIASISLVGYASSGLSASELSQRKQLLTSINKGNYKGANNASTTRLLHPSHQQDNELVDFINTMNNDLGSQVLKAQIESTTPRPDLTAALSQLNIPVNIIASEDDQLVPFSQVQAMHQKLPQSELLVIKQAGHMMPLEQTAAVAEALTRLLT